MFFGKRLFVGVELIENHWMFVNNQSLLSNRIFLGKMWEGHTCRIYVWIKEYLSK